MWWLRTTEVVLGLLVILVLVTQIVYPLYKGRQTFPIFRRQQKLEKELAEANQEQYEADLAAEVKKSQPSQSNQPKNGGL
jgi:F0F1-type ATP synthase membrane subunit b/b'